MHTLFLVVLVAGLLSLFLTPLCGALSRACGLVDRPDSKRKLHAAPTPRVGGIAIAIAYLAALAIIRVSPLHGLSLAYEIVPAAAIVFLTGLLDDVVSLRPWQKLAGQLIAGCVAYHSGVQFTTLAGHAFPVWLDLPITLIWLVGCSNAFNLIDGIDGLATGVGLFATVTMLIAAILQHNLGLALATAPLAAALLAFLAYNFNPASIFLGDCGSLLIGFLLGAYGIHWSHKATTMLGMSAPIMALSVPLIETVVSILRRALGHKPIFGADRGHIHHRLLDRGLTPRRVALLIYGVCGIAAAFSLICSMQERLAGSILVLFCAVAWTGIQSLRYSEFSISGRRLRKVQDSLAAAATPEQCWNAIHSSLHNFGFQGADVTLAGQNFSQPIPPGSSARMWTVRIPLPGYDEVTLRRSLDSPPAIIAPYAELIGRTLPVKLNQFRPHNVPPDLVQWSGKFHTHEASS